MMPCFRRLTILALLVSFLAAGASARADDWPVARGPSHEPDPYRYDPAAWKQVRRTFLEDTAACTLYSATSHLIEADGIIESIYHEITRLNGRKGVESLGEYHHITYDPGSQKLTLNEARVVKPDGRVVQIEPRHVQLRDASTDYTVYDADKQLVISFPTLEVGDVYEVKWSTRGKSPEFGKDFFTRYTFGDLNYPVVRDELRVRLPKDRQLKYAPVGGKVEPIIRESGKDRLYRWTMTNVPEAPQDSDLPSKEELRPQVMCSTYASWEAVGKWKQQLRADCWRCTPGVRKVVGEVTAGLKSPLEKARALTYWVRRRIRYVSFTSGRDGYTPRPPAVVLGNRFGDCKDQAQLLAVMLREAGVPVALVTLGVRDDGQIVPEVPSPWGSHAILLVQLDGRDHWIDTTATMAAWDFLPRDDRDRVVYVTGDKGIRVLRTPALTFADNRFEATTDVQVQLDGSSYCRRTLTYHGLAALNRRDAWTDVPGGERRRLMTAELQDADSRARLRRLDIDEKTLRDLDQPVQATVEYELSGQFADPEREGSFTDSKIWARLLAYTLDHERKLPLDLGTPFESVHRYVIHLPPSYRFDSLPADREVTSSLGSFRLEARQDVKDPHRLEVTFRTRLEKPRVEPGQFQAFRKFHREVNLAWRAWVTLGPTRELSDAAPLEALLAWCPSDLGLATTLVRLYQKHERFEDARRVLRQAVKFHPHETTLWELTVTTAANLEQEEAAYREMVRRFPDETKYALALGQTCVSRGHHAAARQVLEPLTCKGPAVTQAQAHYQLARSALLEKHPAEALKHFQAARAADADSITSAEAWRLQAQAHEALGQPAEAIDAYRKALGQSATDRQFLAALVRLELQQGQRGEALDHLRRYTLAVAGDLEGLVQAAAFHLEMGRLEDALELASRARDIAFHAGAQRVLGLVYLQRGDYEKAVFHLDRAQPDAQVLLGLIRANLALGRLSQALTHTQAANALAGPPELRQACTLTVRLAKRKLALLKEVKDVPANRTAACIAAIDALVCAEQAHRDGMAADRVEALLSRAFPAGVEIGAAYSLRGLLALERGRLNRALADATRALAIDRGDAGACYVRGRVSLERGQIAEALPDLARAVELSGRKDAAALHWLATALSQAGRREEALVAQRQAVRLRPQDQEMLEQLRDLERTSSGNTPGASGRQSSR